MRNVRAVLLLAMACGMAGCGGGGGGGGGARVREQLDGQPIMAPRGRLPTEPYSPVDQPGQVPYDDARVPRDTRTPTKSERPLSPAANRTLDSAVPPLAQPFAQSATAPATTKRAASPGSYMTIGGVVAEVNGTPVYADQIVSQLEPLLAARAPELEPEQFKRLATDEIRKQIRENVQRELLVAAAERTLDEKDKKQAEYATEMWRQQQITEAGGSIETVRRRDAQQGRDFDARVKDEYRRTISTLLLRKKIIPQVQVTAAEMRKYYDDNRDTLFTVRDAAQFEMIQIDPAKVGGREAAKQKIEDLRQRALNGEDFAALAKFSNALQMRNRAGELPWMDRGAFAITPVEDAAWKLQTGGVSEVIEDGGKFYIVHLERKQPGRVKPFEEEAIQNEINKTLFAQKFDPLKRKLLDDLERQSIIRAEPEMMQSAIEIAMQRYAQWAGK